MGGSGLVKTRSGRDLASVYLANGAEFLPQSSAVDGRDARDACYATAIAAELVLKAFLASQGWSDDRCRQDIRHNLEKGLAAARDAGLSDVSSELADVIAVLNAYYPRHAFDRFSVPADEPAFPSRARAAVAGLFDIVRPYVMDAGGR